MTKVTLLVGYLGHIVMGKSKFCLNRLCKERVTICARAIFKIFDIRIFVNSVTLLCYLKINALMLVTEGFLAPFCPNSAFAQTKTCPLKKSKGTLF